MVDFAGRYQLSETEARRIALESESAAVWERTWKDETWWKDGENTCRVVVTACLMRLGCPSRIDVHLYTNRMVPIR